MKRNKGFLFVAAVGAFLALVPWALGTTVIRMSLAEMAKGADLVVEGKVLAAAGFQDEKGRIFTRITLQAAQYVKGSGPPIFEFVVPGGTANGRGLLVPGLPGFQLGESTLLFLTPAGPAGARVPVGYAQGKYRIGYDAKTGCKLALRESFAGLQLVSSQTGAPVQPDGNGVRDFEEFVAEIRRILAEGK